MGYKVERDSEQIDCPECDGDGTVTWTYNDHEDEFDCPECDGDGTVEKKSGEWRVENEEGEVLQTGSLYHCEAWVIQKESGYIKQ